MGDGRANLLGTRQGRHALVGSFFASIALPISAVITGPIFARTIAATGRGEATTVTAPLILGVGLVSGGLYSATVYYVSRRAEHAAVVVRSGAKLAIGTGVVLTLIIIAIAPALARQSPELVEPIRWCALVLPVIVLGRVGRGVEMARQQYQFVYRLVVFSAFVRTAAVVVAALLGILDVKMAIIVLIGFEVLQAVPMIVRQVPTFRSRQTSGPSLNEFVRYSGASAFGAATANLSTRLDLVILAPLVAASSLGAYVFAFGLSQMWAGTVRALAGVALPELARTRDHAAAASLCRLLFAASIVVTLAVVAFGPWIVSLFYGEGFDTTARLLPLVMIASSIAALEQIPGAVLLAEGAPVERSLAQALGAVVTIIGLAIAAPRWGVSGAAVVSTAAYLLTALATFSMVRRRVDQSWRDYLIVRRDDFEIVGSIASDIRTRFSS